MATEQASSKTNPLLAHIVKSETNVRLREGEVVNGTLLKKESRAAYFDIANFGTGIIYGAELQSSKEIIKSLNVGDVIAAKIDSLDGHMGYVELSLSEAGRQKAWQKAKQLEESGEVIKIKITGANQGGLVGDLSGLKAFLPVSQLAAEHAPKSEDRMQGADEMKKLIGEELSVKVITVTPRANKLIVSERETVTPSSNVKELLQNYAVGQVVPGLVSGIADFGIFVRFVDTPEIEGLVHISEIDHRIIDSPKEIVKLNQNVQVKIIDIKEGRVFLSLKALKADPWADVADKYKEGQNVAGTVYKFNPFGAIVDLEGGLQGLIHVSEFGGADEMKAAVKVGDNREFVIGAVKPEEKRIILKLKK
jgi:small subunit ribosomal protein S1